jgi:ATP adenylyltransferase
LGSKPETCIFCDKIDAEDEAEYVLFRGRTAYITLNRYPYNNGHLLIVPYAHVSDLEDLLPETLQEMMLLVTRSLAVLREAMQPQGFNVGANLGELAGAGIESHVHLHVVPRWSGDTSFMTVLGNTRTIPESLDQTYTRLCRALAKLEREDTGTVEVSTQK